MVDPHYVVTHQLQVERRTGKVRRPKTDVLPLCRATNLCMCVVYRRSVGGRQGGVYSSSDGADRLANHVTGHRCRRNMHFTLTVETTAVCCCEAAAVSSSTQRLSTSTAGLLPTADHH